MIYSAWEGDGGCTFVEGDIVPESLRSMLPDLALVRTFEADSWDDAMRQYHEWQGWEPYKPME